MTEEKKLGRKSIPSEIEVELDRMVYSGEARGRYGRRLVFAWGGLPGETVRAKVTRKRRQSLNTIVTDVLRSSSDRIVPREDHYLCCSPWQVVSESLESKWKIDAVRELYSNTHDFDLPDFQIQNNETFGYRNKLEFGFTDTVDGVSLSFFQRGSYRQRIAIDGCLLGQAAINSMAQRICTALREQQVSAESLKSLVLRSNRVGEVAAALFVTDPSVRILQGLAAQEKLTGLRLFHSDPKSPASVASSLIEEAGTPILEESILDLKLQFSERSFFQVNIPLFEYALRDMREYVLADGPFFDLYSGVGTIGICLQRPDAIFVESEPECVEMLKKNCDRNGIDNPVIHAERAEKVIESIPANATVVLDPPRAGLHPKVVKRLLASTPRRIIYLSCNPKTQAADLANLLTRYQLIDFRAYNFFPRTPHIESLAVLES